MDNNQLFTELNSEDSASVNGGGTLTILSRVWNVYSGLKTLNDLFKYNTRMAPYRDANGRTTTSYDPYDKPRLVIMSGTAGT